MKQLDSAKFVANHWTLMSILLSVERDTPCTSILLAVERDTPCMFNFCSYCWRWKRMHPACPYCWRWKGIPYTSILLAVERHTPCRLYVHTPGCGNGYTLHVHSNGCGKVHNRDTPYSRSVIAFFSRCPVGDGTKAVNREDKRSRRYRDRHFAKFEMSRRYRDR